MFWVVEIFKFTSYMLCFHNFSSTLAGHYGDNWWGWWADWFYPGMFDVFDIVLVNYAE